MSEIVYDTEEDNVEGGIFCSSCCVEFDIIYDNVPWLSIDYCPFCGEELDEST